MTTAFNPNLNQRRLTNSNAANKRKATKTSLSFFLYNLVSFLIGIILCNSFFAYQSLAPNHPQQIDHTDIENAKINHNNYSVKSNSKSRNSFTSESSVNAAASIAMPILYQKKILIALASFNFDQLTYFEEQLEGFRGLVEAGAHVTIVVHATEPYSVALIDVLNTRMYHETGADDDTTAGSFCMKIVLLSPSVRLHLVDYHRSLFYEHLNDFDLFIYSEDDMKANPQLVANYLAQTEKVARLVGPGKASDYNVGIIRYEYNYPFDVVIDDNTRLMTRNATRVFWEHSQGRPVFEKVTDEVDDPALSSDFMTLRNNHQGMFMATQALLRAWKDRSPNCRFDEVRDRPGWKNKPSQPAEGTQRVWMSSVMLYGSKHCNVKLLIPVKSFGKMNVHHIPNKNYRRVGRKGRLGGYAEDARGSLNYENVTSVGPHPSLMKVYEVHFAMRQKFPFGFEKDGKYNGIEVVDKIDPRYLNYAKEYAANVKERLQAYDRYVKSGGVLTAVDMEKYL